MAAITAKETRRGERRGHGNTHKSEFDNTTMNLDFAALMEPIARELLGDPNKELSKGDKLRFGTNGSLSVDLAAGRWYSHEEELGGGVLDLLARELGLATRAEQLRWLESNGFKERSEAPATPKPKQTSSITAIYDYTDEHGELLFQAVRMEPKSFRQRRPFRGGWAWRLEGAVQQRRYGNDWYAPSKKGIGEAAELPPLTQVPYRLPELLARPNDPVFVVEGEKDVDRLVAFGLLATCNAAGAGKWTEAHSQPLGNRRVIVLPDNDEAGRDHAEKVRTSLEAAGAQVRVVALPGLPAKGDVSDWLDSGGNRESLLALLKSHDHDITPTPPVTAPEFAPVDDDGDKQAQTDLIVAFVQQHHELFHDANDETYARSRDTGEVRRIGGKAFKHWLTAAFYKAHEKAVRDQSLREARMTLEGLAMVEERSVHIRVAKVAGEYWLDLAEPGSSKAVKLRPGHWEVVEHPGAVMFCRSESAHPLPEPVKGGSLEPLWEITKLPHKWRLLVVALLVEYLRPDTPYPVTEILGEQGSGKSFLQMLLRRLLDPNAADLRSVPKSAEDVFISGGANHIISIENVSHLTPQLQDALCVVATGGGFAKRKLYSDADETVITLKRPVMLNGIVASVTQQDLVSRTITIELPVLSDAQSKDQLEEQFEANRASIIGALLDIAAKALTYLPEMTLPARERPRLVEFAYLGMAVAKAMGGDPNTFTKQFAAARQDGLERTLDASPVATAIRDWAETYPREAQEKTAKEWLLLMESYKPSGCDSWPRSAKGMGDQMRRAAPALRQLGIECTCLGKIGGSVKWLVGQADQRNSWNQSPESPEVLVNDGGEQDIRTCRTLIAEKSLGADDFEEF
ncbi:toprim domain-containing protein [Halomonas sp. MC140]|nr:toprim domain-containing protein [Halomonas sp. MC140]MDN7131983.1 toprim domain-containing protein [Halomonas sp. MC140]